MFKVVIFAISIIAIVFFLVIVHFLVFDSYCIEQCKVFLLNNTAVQDLFGDIESIKVKFIGSSKQSSREGSVGCYSFRLKGTKRKANIKVRWQLHDDKVSITEITMRKGFAGTDILWPKSKTELTGYILPSYTWDGLILLFLAFLNFLFYWLAKKRSKIISYIYPSFLRIGDLAAMSWGFLIVGYACIAYSILCFLNICTLF